MIPPPTTTGLMRLGASVKTLMTLTPQTSFVAYYSLLIAVGCVADDCVIVAFCARADIADAEQ